MVKTCKFCGHTGETTWRDGEYRCAMCGGLIPDTDPVVEQYTPVSTYSTKAVCPICKNAENNAFDGSKYRCALCATRFDLVEPVQQDTYSPVSSYSVNTQRVTELKKQKEKYFVLGLVFIFIFWPVAIYFFYKFYTIGKELKTLGY